MAPRVRKGTTWFAIQPLDRVLIGFLHVLERELYNLKNEPKKIDKCEYDKLKNELQLLELEKKKLQMTLNNNSNSYKLGVNQGRLIVELKKDLELHKQRL